MKRSLPTSAAFPSLVCLSLVLTCAAEGLGDTTRGSGVTKREKRSIAAFTQLHVSGPVDVEFTRSPDTSAVVEADDNIVPLVDTISHGDELEIDAHQAYSSSNPVRVILKGPSLKRVESSGSGSSVFHGLTGDRFDIRVSGSGGARGDGSIGTVNADLSGSGDILLSQLKATDAAASLSGSGNIELDASRSLDASISGSGSIHCTGHPATVHQNVTGSGHVSVD